MGVIWLIKSTKYYMLLDKMANDSEHAKNKFTCGVVVIQQLFLNYIKKLQA